MVLKPRNSTFLSSCQLTKIIHWSCYCTVHVYVLIHICDSEWSFWTGANRWRPFIVCLYMYDSWRSKYKRRRVGVPLSAPHHRACPKRWHEFLSANVVSFCVIYESRLKTVICYADFGGIIDHHCLIFFITTFPGYSGFLRHKMCSNIY